MQKYLEYLSFLRWPRGFLTSWQLENSIFSPQNSRLEHKQSLGWGVETHLKTGKFWFSFPTEQIPTFLTTRASSGSLNSVKKEKNPQKLAFPACQFPGISKQQHYNKHGTHFLTPALASESNFGQKTPLHPYFFGVFFFSWENRAGTRTKETNPMPRMLRNTQQRIPAPPQGLRIKKTSRTRKKKPFSPPHSQLFQADSIREHRLLCFFFFWELRRFIPPDPRIPAGKFPSLVPAVPAAGASSPGRGTRVSWPRLRPSAASLFPGEGVLREKKREKIGSGHGEIGG